MKFKKTAIAAVAVVALGAGVASCSGGDDNGGSKPDKAPSNSVEKKHKPANPSNDVTSVKIKDKTDTSDPSFVMDDVWVGYTVTNHSSKTSDYTIDYEVVDASGTRIFNSTALVTNVRSGQTMVQEDVTTLTHQQVVDGAKLSVTHVDRTASASSYSGD